ncbi:hypothetical protein JTE90_018466 [Oedothorax gibbosus]|uniref:Uncharacterized protein n=1 Tax=Oedothorax gibbosus TaxID=931172 RepID=A0AAV6UXU2_9ARAC|nr:hypothetical protein JTE90_018466 [Oedothorax gibbosus]
MSICDKSANLLESYNVLRNSSNSFLNSSTIQDPVFQHWCTYGPPSYGAHMAVGLLLGAICAASVAGNLLVVVVFTRTTVTM